MTGGAGMGCPWGWMDGWVTRWTKRARQWGMQKAGPPPSEPHVTLPLLLLLLLLQKRAAVDVIISRACTVGAPGEEPGRCTF
jgi:hypothetical protein